MIFDELNCIAGHHLPDNPGDVVFCEVQAGSVSDEIRLNIYDTSVDIVGLVLLHI